MSAKSDLVVIGSSSSSSLKLWKSYSSVSSVLLLVFAHCMQLCCLSQQSPNLCFSPASMRLRPKRYMGFSTCSFDFNNTRVLVLLICFWVFD